MKQFISIFVLLGLYCNASSQELYVYTEPASNMPAHTLSPRLSSTFGKEADHLQTRIVPEIMLGISKKFMLHVATSFSNMHTNNFGWESIYVYGKYRFYSADDVHKHFRMALFGEATHSRNEYQYDEVNIQGDRSGFQLGLIATQLINKLAVSGTVSHTQAMDPSRFDKVDYNPPHAYQSLNYSLSTGYLLLPRVYSSYRQLNFNLYLELLGQQTLDRKTFYLDLAPAIQFIFNSNSKLNIGYRFQLDGNQYRMEKSFLVAFEHTFFNVLKK